MTATRPFDTPEGLVTTAKSTVRVIDGEPSQGGSTWNVPVTPAGAYLAIEQDLDGDMMRRVAYVTVPDVPAMSYSELLFNRGNGEGGTEPYWWTLASSGEFPPEAIDGDLGIDPVTGDVWRYNA
ncbi:MAG: hypothetical protein IJO71_09105 [Microbacterium sp.]|uniref:hypothetical protein n=1 Tax=Microbacterium sp. TaxID=51671 RepID=UPI0025DC5A3B|nr:hypothetical protein [Microbacterium sp.]MBQ9917343.1 hypothetical protein [Microbacterium sp.]